MDRKSFCFEIKWKSWWVFLFLSVIFSEPACIFVQAACINVFQTIHSVMAEKYYDVKNTKTTTSTTTTTVLWPFVCDYPGELVPEVTFTNSHLSWSSIFLYQLPPSTTIHSIFPVQFTWLFKVLHNSCPSPLWSASWSVILHFILHTFLHPVIVFFSHHMPIPSQPVLL